MWEWNYGKEPFDMKLTVLRFVKNIWIPVIAALLGAAIVGGGYFLVRDVFGGPEEYAVTSTYYVEYGTDPQTGNEYTYTNAASWNNWIVTDWFVDRIWDSAVENGLQPEKYGVTKQDLPTFLSADLPTDLRIPTSKVTTTDPELTGILAEAVEEVFVSFADAQKEMDAIRVVDTTEVYVVDKDIRTLRACILGAVLGLFFAVVGMLLYLVMDDGIYLPETFSCRYGIPALGAVYETNDGLELSKGTEENVAYLVKDCESVAVTSVEEDTDLKAVASLFKDKEYVCVPGILQVPEAVEKLRGFSGVLLLAQAGVCNGKKIEHVLHELKVQDCKVLGVILTDADERLIGMYRMTGYRGEKA